MFYTFHMWVSNFLLLVVFHFGNRNSFLPALEMSNSGTRDTVDVHSPITLTHAEIQNVITMLPEDRCYKYRFVVMTAGNHKGSPVLESL